MVLLAPHAAASWVVQGISQEVVESEALGMQESVQLAGTSSGDIFIVQHIEQTAGLDDVRYTAVIDHDDQIFVEGNVPVDVRQLLVDLLDSFDDISVVPCRISFPNLDLHDDGQEGIPEKPQFLNEATPYNYILLLVEGQWDFGDDPDQYHTLLKENGARHLIVPGYHLGANIDAEPDGFPGDDAAGDNHNGSDDEDGVAFLQPIQRGARTLLNVTASAPGSLNAWLDSNCDGDWSDAGEMVISNQWLSAGDNYISLDVPENATAGRAYMRFRFSSSGGLLPYGAALDGEVEDYLIDII